MICFTFPEAPFSPLLSSPVPLCYEQNNPTATLGILSESVVILVSCLADEMLYRAVALTLVALWLRDRMYEAGVVDLDDLLVLPSWGGGGEVDAVDAAK